MPMIFSMRYTMRFPRGNGIAREAGREARGVFKMAETIESFVAKLRVEGVEAGRAEAGKLTAEAETRAREIAKKRTGYRVTMVNLYHDTMPKAPDAVVWPHPPRKVEWTDEMLDLAIAGGYMLCGNPEEVCEQLEAYQSVGGHAAVKDHATEDIALAKAVRRKGYRWCLMDATSLVSARMYSGLRDAVAGFSKNLFALFNYHLLVALFVWLWLLTITWHPIGLVAAAIATGRAAPLASVGTIALACGTWLLTSLRFGLPWHLFLLSPAIVTVSACTGIRALVLVLTGQAYWKGRRLVARRPRLI